MAGRPLRDRAGHTDMTGALAKLTGYYAYGIFSALQ
jgi:hypothetical protein